MPSPVEIKKAIDTLTGQFEKFKEVNDAELKRIEAKSGNASDESTIKTLNEAMEKQEKAIEDLQVAIKRESKESEVEKLKTDKEVKHAMSEVLRHGTASAEQVELIKSAYPDEMKALSVDSNPAGGYTVRPAVSNEITSKIFESSPMRMLSGSETISTDAWEEIYDYDEPDYGWVSERGSRPETNTSELNMIRIPVHEMYAMPKLTQKIIDDSSINIETWHQNKVIKKFGRAEATSFISGNGVGKAKGILSYAAGDGFDQIEQIVSGHATLITDDQLMALQDSLYEEFQANANWLMRRQSATAVRQLKDNDGRYLFSLDPQAGLNGGSAFSLLGKPLHYAADMPAVGAGALSIAYGDFKEGYKIVDRVGIRVIRDIFTSKGNVLIYTTKRVGGGVSNFQAMKLMKISA